MSGRAVGRVLRAEGHDVRAINEEGALEGLPDESVLELAALEGRILVTSDVADFPPILRDWATEQRPHAGCILVFGIGHREHGLLLRGLRAAFTRRPGQSDWIDRVEALTKTSGESSSAS